MNDKEGLQAIAQLQTPQLDKKRACKAQALTLSEFVDWLTKNGMAICEQDRGNANVGSLGTLGYYPIRKRTERLFADFFGIDLVEMEKEREAVLAQLRGENP